MLSPNHPTALVERKSVYANVAPLAEFPFAEFVKRVVA
jgi:hypothetical protein